MNDRLNALKTQFRERTLANADDLARAVKDQDFKALEQIIHSIAGAAGMFGYAALSERALAIDADFAAGRRPTEQCVTELIGVIRRECGVYS